MIFCSFCAKNDENEGILWQKDLFLAQNERKMANFIDFSAKMKAFASVKKVSFLVI